MNFGFIFPFKVSEVSLNCIVGMHSRGAPKLMLLLGSK
jgi:hypothetical protein